jgi:hypothetical protein
VNNLNKVNLNDRTETCNSTSINHNDAQEGHNLGSHSRSHARSRIPTTTTALLPGRCKKIFQIVNILRIAAAKDLLNYQFHTAQNTSDDEFVRLQLLLQRQCSLESLSFLDPWAWQLLHEVAV